MNQHGGIELVREGSGQQALQAQGRGGRRVGGAGRGRTRRRTGERHGRQHGRRPQHHRVPQHRLRGGHGLGRHRAADRDRRAQRHGHRHRRRCGVGPGGERASGLEVNHGPEAAAIAGDCWEGNTPDIRPGDVVSVRTVRPPTRSSSTTSRSPGSPASSATATSSFRSPAPRRRGRDPGRAARLRRVPRAADPQLRFEGVPAVRRPGAAPGQYNLVYRTPFQPARNRNGLTQRQIRTALLGDGHAIGFGHSTRCRPSRCSSTVDRNPRPGSGL